MNGSQFADLDFNILFSGLGLSLFSVLLLGVLSLVFSAYVKIVTVLGIVRLGIGGFGLPSAFVVTGMSFAVSFFVMYPTLRDSTQQIERVLRESGPNVSDADRALALHAALDEWKKFLIRYTQVGERERFAQLAAELNVRYRASTLQRVSPIIPDQEDRSVQSSRAEALAQLKESWRVLCPAFLVSQLKEAFLTGLGIFLPFLVVELLVSHVLLAVGLTQLNPALVSFPFKLLLFVIADGWTLITTNLVSTYLK